MKILDELKNGLDGVKADLSKELQEKVSGEVAEKYNTIGEEIKGIKDKLDTYMKEGDKSSDQHVQDLEAKLDEMEKKHSDLVEEFRLKNAGGVTGKQEKKDSLKGFFFKDQKAIADGWRAEASGAHVEKSVDSTLFTAGGQLPSDAAMEFWKSVVEQQPTLNIITKRALIGSSGTTDELTVAARSMVAATESTAPTDPDVVAFRRRTINTVEVIWPVDMSKTFLEDNIERGNAEQTIVNQIATQFGNDVEDLGWNGDDDSSVTFLSINDGWVTLAAADSNVNDVTSYDSGASMDDVMREWMLSMPTKFQGLPDLTYFIPWKSALYYADQVATRATNLGDDVLIEGLPALRYFGHRIIPVPYLTSTTGMLTPASNLYLAYNRAVTIDSEWKPRKRIMEVTISARQDYEYSSGQAIVLGTNIPSGLTS